MQETMRVKIKLACLLLVAFVPITLATIAFRNAGSFALFDGSVNKGNLITPPADITDLDMRGEDGEPLFETFEDRVAELENSADYEPEPWLIVYVSTADCESDCRERIHLLRQMHITLGKDMPRVRRYYLNADDAPLAADTLDYFREEFPSMGVAQGNEQQIEANLAAGELDLDLSADAYIFFIDPVGNVMMYYDSSHGVDDIKKDLEQLLRYSSLG